MRAARISLATISEDGLYRYTLSRKWGTLSAPRRILFVMLNPSTADADQDDPTIRRCMGFARCEDCCDVDVVNLYAYRATDPTELTRARARGVDIVGPGNDAAIRELAPGAHRVVVAWGARADVVDQDGARRRAVLDLLAPAALTCLGTTASGAPRHPLMVAGATPLVTWRPSS